ncbi:MAG TPA: magnesium transporter [Candidatus Babeliales bacterium]|nr:magnesium transporter [Candidatus Babeliales bacterium]
MTGKQILQEIRENIDAVIDQESTFGQSLWKAFLEIHPADIAQFLTNLDKETLQRLFLKLPKELKLAVFEDLSDVIKVYVLSVMSEHELVEALNTLNADKLTDLFDLLSDEELKRYLDLLHKKARQEVISLMKFHPESAGGIMDIRVLTLMDDFTVEKSIKILQRLRPRREIHQQIYITDHSHRLIGHIQLEDLVMHDPKSRISSFIRKNELVAMANEDREVIAQQMVHYGLMTVPVVGDNNHFLGVIPSETLVDVIVEEATEDVQKMSALTPLKYPYFETPFWRLLYERSYILIALLLAESFSNTILNAYEATLGLFLMSFIPMLISAGGNTSSQTSAMVIQGMASGDIHNQNMFKFLRREIMMAAVLALILGITAFVRVYLTAGTLLQCCAISLTLAMIVMASVTLGSCIPLLLKRFNIDPAFSAGPFLATLMDILGILIYCYVSKLILC